MNKTEVSKIVKVVMVILYFAAVFPMIIYFGREFKEIRALKTSDEISRHFCSYDRYVDDWKFFQLFKGKDQVSGWGESLRINDENREQILKDFQQMELCKTAAQGFIVCLIISMAFIGMKNPESYMPAWGTCLGIETFAMEFYVSYFVIDLVRDDLYCPVSGVIIGFFLFFFINIADWIRKKMQYEISFKFSLLTVYLAVSHFIVCVLFFYPLRYNDDMFVIPFMVIPVFGTALFCLLILRLLQKMCKALRKSIRKNNLRT